MNIRFMVLFIKVFCILFILGIIFPYIINIVLSKIHFLNEQIPSGNSIFVMHKEFDQVKLKDILYDFFYGFVEFHRK